MRSLDQQLHLCVVKKIENWEKSLFEARKKTNEDKHQPETRYIASTSPTKTETEEEQNYRQSTTGKQNHYSRVWGQLHYLLTYMHMLDISSREQHVREVSLISPVYPVKRRFMYPKKHHPYQKKIPMGACIEQAALEGTGRHMCSGAACMYVNICMYTHNNASQNLISYLHVNEHTCIYKSNAENIHVGK